MRNLLVILFFVAAMFTIFFAGYLTADRAPKEVRSTVTVVVKENGGTNRVAASRRSSPKEDADESPPVKLIERSVEEPPYVEAKTEETRKTTNESLVVSQLQRREMREAEPVPPPMRELGPLVIHYPKPMFVGTPVPIKLPNMEAPTANSGGTVMVPAGTKLISRDMPVTSSDKNPLLGDLCQITDGDKSAEEGSFVELAGGLQWVQIDLMEVRRIEAIALWHYHLQARAYKDVIVLVSNDPEFKSGVLPVTRDIYTGAYFSADPRQKLGAMLFNNDDDNSAGWSKGTDPTYVDSYRGRVISGWGITARFVRLYSNGNTANGMNHYVEVEVYGM